MLSSILESKFYKSQEFGEKEDGFNEDQCNREQTMSLTDINQQDRQVQISDPYKKSDEEDFDDKQLLESLEKRFRNIEQIGMKSTDSGSLHDVQSAIGEMKLPRQRQRKEVNLLEELSKAMQRYSEDGQDVQENKTPNYTEDRFHNIDKPKKVERNLIEGIDNDIKRTEESLKEMNQRFERIK